jgi:LacI family transcriptional regulator
VRLTIRDIAKEAGVGLGTVSRVLNDSPHVSPATRAKVLEVIDKHNYRLHAVARSLAKRCTNTVGVIVPQFTKRFFIEVLKGIQGQLDNSGRDLILYNVQNRVQKEEIFERITYEKPVDGIIVINLRLTDRHCHLLQEAGLPVVLVDSERHEFTSIVSDNARGAEIAVTHLIELGHKEIGMVNGLMRYHASRQRLQGYKKALTDHGIEVNHELVVNSEFCRAGGYEAATALLSRVTPTAIFAASDEQAIGIMDYAKKAGIQIPQKLAIVGFDDIDLVDFIGLSTMRQSMEEMGSVAASKLLEMLTNPNDEENPPERIVFCPRLIVRSSCGSQV